jgi:hypothetical protein
MAVVLLVRTPFRDSIASRQLRQIGRVVASALGVRPALSASLRAVISPCAPGSLPACSSDRKIDICSGVKSRLPPAMIVGPSVLSATVVRSFFGIQLSAP